MRCHTLDMRTSAALRPLVATALMLALLSGCSLLGDLPKWGAKRDAAKAVGAGGLECLEHRRYSLA